MICPIPKPVPFLVFALILFCSVAAYAQAGFAPARPWLDTAGQPIQSHSGGLLFDNGVYYWYGSDYRGPRIPPNTLAHQTFAWFLNLGLTVYSSTDLMHWKPEANQLAGVVDDSSSLLQPLSPLIRPKVIKNDTTGKYVLMAALIAPDFDSANDIVYATADHPAGPFRLMGKLGWCGTPNAGSLWTGPWAPGSGLRDFEWASAAKDAPGRIRGFDMALFKDDDGKAYLLTAHSRILLYELSADYTCVKHVEVMQNPEGEAPALFKDRGTYYLLSSRLTGWYPNSNSYFTAPSIHGPWTPQGPFAHGPREQTTFDGQTTFVLPVQGTPHSFIFIADHFGAKDAMDIPDFTAATHIWLPIEIDGTKRSLQVNWMDSWKLSDLSGTGQVH